MLPKTNLLLELCSIEQCNNSITQLITYVYVLLMRVNSYVSLVMLFDSRSNMKSLVIYFYIHSIEFNNCFKNKMKKQSRVYLQILAISLRIKLVILYTSHPSPYDNESVNRRNPFQSVIWVHWTLEMPLIELTRDKTPTHLCKAKKKKKKNHYLGFATKCH